MTRTETVVPDTEESVIRVSRTTPPQDLAGAIAGACYDGNPPVIRAIGAGAVNQTVKGIILASQFVASHGHTLSVRPGFQDISGDDGKTISAIVFRLTLG